MAAKKKTPATPPAKRPRKAAKEALADPGATPVAETPPVEPATAETAPVEVPMPAAPVPPAEVADRPATPEAAQPPEVESPPVETTLDTSNREAERPDPAAPATPEATLRYWQVRRGPQILGQTLAGNEEWALKYARQQFGDDVTVEPGRVAPGPKERAQRPQKDKEPGKLSALDAAAKVLAETGRPMTCQELIGAMAAKGYWSSPAGKTPAATLYSALLRETTSKGDQARFVKAGRGMFALRLQA